MTDLEKRYIKQARVSATWLDGNTSFWYRRDAASGETQFIFVDATKKIRRDAFDAEALVTALKRETGADINPAKLPFESIDLAPDASWVRFSFEKKSWQFDGEGLKEWEGTLDEGEEEEAVEETRSPRSTERVVVTFLNHSGVKVTMQWLDGGGDWRGYFDLGPGEVQRQPTRVGHVWRAVERETGKVRRRYAASRAEATCVIGDATRRAKPMKGGKDVDNKSDTGKSTAKDEKGKVPELFIKRHNIWFRLDKEEEPLTFDGHDNAYYNEKNIFVTDDGAFAVVHQVTPDSDVKLRLLEHAPKDQLRPMVHDHQKYLRPGDPVETHRPRLFDLKAKKEILTDDTLFRNPLNLSPLHSAGWDKAQHEYRFVYHERGHQCVRVIGISRQGEVRVILEETTGTFIEQAKTYCHIFADTDEILWASERDGYNHLYLYDLAAGRMAAQVTSGEWNVNFVEEVDEAERTILLRGYGLVQDQDPYYAHLVRAKLPPVNSSSEKSSPWHAEFQVLTAGDGTHHWSWSPDRRFLIDTWSRIDAPPTTVLRHGNTGAHILDLETISATTLLEEGWVAPEPFVAPGRDGKTPIYGIIVRPPQAASAPEKKYPILEDIYAGPHDFHVPKAVGSLSRTDRKFAAEGFVVVHIDGMGTNWRSHEFHSACWHNLADAGLPDRIAWIRAAAATRPWMDLGRVGIRGASAGGHSAAAAVLHHGEFYKVAIADSAPHDLRLDKRWWPEQWMGWPVGRQYEESSNAVHAAKLQEGKGRGLMLMVGDMDDNVDPAATMAFAKALNDCGKVYELVFMPGGGHCGGGHGYGLERQKEFLKRHLLDV